MLGAIEIRLIGWLQLKKKKSLRKGEAAAALNLSSLQENRLLSRLENKGLICRIKRGLYLVPDYLPPGGKWNPGGNAVLYSLMKSVGASYQISGPTAFQLYGLDNQIPNLTYVYNDKISGRRKLGELTFIFIKVSKKWLGSTKILIQEQQNAINTPTLTRTLVDAVYDWKRFNTLPKAFKWIKDNSKNKVSCRALTEDTLRYGNIATRKRIGFTLEKMGKKAFADLIKKSVSRNLSLIPYDPSAPTRGVKIESWGIIDNSSN